MKNRDQELWACALWVETHHPDAGPAFIGDQVKRQAEAGDAAGVRHWRAVAERYDALIDGTISGRH
jgi:hypothetical protein